MKEIFVMPAIEIVKFETENVRNFESWQSGGNDLGWKE